MRPGQRTPNQFELAILDRIWDRVFEGFSISADKFDAGIPPKAES